MEFYDTMELINTAPKFRGSTPRMSKNTITVSSVGKSGKSPNTVRFSAELSGELDGFDSASLYRNSITSELFIVFFKDDKGMTPLRYELKKGRDAKYPMLGGDFANKIRALSGVPNEYRKAVRFRISENLSKMETNATYKIIGPESTPWNKA